MPNVMGIDPGFASIGVVIVELTESTEAPFWMTVVETKKSGKKQQVLACHDNFMRAQEIARRIDYLIDNYKVVAVCAESMSFPRNASTAAKVALTWGVLADICERRNLSMVQPTPVHIKKVVTGNRKASKEDVQKALACRYPSIEDQLMAMPKTKREHAADALGAVVASLDSDVVRMARRM